MNKPRRFAPYTLMVRNQLAAVSELDRSAFKRWLNSVKSSKHSQQTDLPSSQLASKMSHVKQDVQQLFVVIDTCSIVSCTHQFMDYVTNLKRLYRVDECPIKIIISLVVLEELDKCNRRGRKVANNGEQHNHQQATNSASRPNDDEAKLNTITERNNRQDPIGDLLSNNSPPRMFMRFIEEEMRTGQVLVGELDPYKQIRLSASETLFEIVNKDDRILECCLRSWAFITKRAHHKDTKLILVSEDNIFKAKATTFGVISFRWREFQTKYQNFGLKNCVPTPLPPLKTIPPRFSLTNIQRTQPQTSPDLSETTSLLNFQVPILGTEGLIDSCFVERSISSGTETTRKSSLQIKTNRIQQTGKLPKTGAEQKKLIRSVINAAASCSGLKQQQVAATKAEAGQTTLEADLLANNEEISIVKEVINLDIL